jgi:tetratricopeptide (TPR) repeat protein
VKADFTEAHFAIARIREARNELAAAEQSYQLAIQSKPNDDRAYLALAALYQRQGKAEEEISTLKELLKSSPTSAPAHYHLALTFLAAGDRPTALQEYVILRESDQTLAGI